MTLGLVTRSFTPGVRLAGHTANNRLKTMLQSPCIQQHGINIDRLLVDWYNVGQIKVNLPAYDLQLPKGADGDYMCAPDNSQFSNESIMTLVRAARREDQLSFMYARQIPDDLANNTQTMEEFIYTCYMNAKICNLSWVPQTLFPVFTQPNKQILRRLDKIYNRVRITNQPHVHLFVKAVNTFNHDDTMCSI